MSEELGGKEFLRCPQLGKVGKARFRRESRLYVSIIGPGRSGGAPEEDGYSVGSNKWKQGRKYVVFISRRWTALYMYGRQLT